MITYIILILILLFILMYYILYKSININDDIYYCIESDLTVKVIDKTFFRVTISNCEEIYNISMFEFLMKYQKLSY